MSVPAGFAQMDGVQLPVGVQFICDAYREDVLLSVGKAFEDMCKR